jgi:hypothetical protein
MNAQLSPAEQIAALEAKNALLGASLRQSEEQAATAQRAADPVESAKTLFGEHPVDVLAVIESSYEALCSLREIFITIEAEAPRSAPGIRLKHLASGGASLAEQISNYAGSEHESMRRSMLSASQSPPQSFVNVRAKRMKRARQLIAATTKKEAGNMYTLKSATLL